MKITDQYNDTAFAILSKQLKKLPDVELFVKEAEINPIEQEQLPRTAFAWEEERKFPIHTDKHAVLSYVYAQSEKNIPSDVLNRIKEALDVYGVNDTIFQMSKTSSNTTIIPEDCYLLPDLKLIPVNSKNVKYAESRLLEQLPKLDLPHRAMAFANLIKVADEHGISVRPESLKLAGLVVSSISQTRSWLEARALVTKDNMYKEAYQTLSDELAKHPIESKDRSGLLKLANSIAELDTKAGLTKFYDRKLPDALQTVFNTDKEAASTVDLGGSLVPLSKFAHLPASFWKDLGGSELSDEIAPGGVVNLAKLAEVIDTLPLDLKIILKSQVRA